MARKSKSSPRKSNTADNTKVVPLLKIDLIEEQWKSVLSMSNNPVITQRLWHMVFTEKERKLFAEYQSTTPLELWQKVRGGTRRQAAIALCSALDAVPSHLVVPMLQKYGEIPYVPPRVQARVLEATIEQGGLVIQDSLREVYWKKEFLPINWSKESRQWSFLCDLARKAQSELSLDAHTFLGSSNANLESIKTIKMRLIRLEGFPSDLAKSIKPSGRGQYRLHLPAMSIHIFSEDTQLIEVQPG